MLKLVWDFTKYTEHFWTSAQLSMTLFLCQLPLASVPLLHLISLINWSEILAAKPYPGGSVGIYLLWIRNWDPETRTISIYSDTEGMWPEELFNGCILAACTQRGNKKPVCRAEENMLRCRVGKWEKEYYLFGALWCCDWFLPNIPAFFQYSPL